MEPAWIMALIAMVGGTLAALIKLISKNGCRLRCFFPNGNPCCDNDCDEGREIKNVTLNSEESCASNG